MNHLLCALLLCVAAPQDDSAHSPGELLGCWSTGGESPQMIRFEAERCTWRRGEELSFYRAGFDEGRVELETWLRVQVLEVELDGDRLHLRAEGDDQSRTFVRLEGVPVELELQIYPVAPATALEPADLAGIQAELATRMQRDQEVRQPDFDPGDEDPRQVMRRESEENSGWTAELIGRVGWIDTERFGRKAALAAFLLVQHSPDLALQQTVLPFIESEVAAGAVPRQDFALLYDRLELGLGRKQSYGTQLGQTSDGQLALMPLLDPAGVHARRRELGMISLRTYLGLFGQEVRLPPGLELPPD